MNKFQHIFEFSSRKKILHILYLKITIKFVFKLFLPDVDVVYGVAKSLSSY